MEEVEAWVANLQAGQPGLVRSVGNATHEDKNKTRTKNKTKTRPDLNLGRFQMCCLEETSHTRHTCTAECDGSQAVGLVSLQSPCCHSWFSKSTSPEQQANMTVTCPAIKTEEV